MVCDKCTEYHKSPGKLLKYFLLGTLSLSVLTACFGSEGASDEFALAGSSVDTGTATPTGTPPSQPSGTPPATPTPPPNLPASDGKLSIFNNSGMASERGFVIVGEIEENVSEAFLSLETEDGVLIKGDMPVEVDAETGQLLQRVESEEIPLSGDFMVASLMRSIDGVDVVSHLPIPINRNIDDITHLISRITYGQTPGLEQHVRGIGYEAFVEEQINPDAIDDSYFDSLDAEGQIIEPEVYNSPGELQSLKVAYAIYSEKQLLERMANFWENHFHTEWRKGLTQHAEVIEKNDFREHALGKFGDLLEVSAQGPAMLTYLDNVDNRVGQMNENYARELLELHTVGVTSTYSEEDIIEVAKILTGWQVESTNVGRPARHKHIHIFKFNPSDHDTSDKTIGFLDATIQGKAGAQGVEEGEELLQLLAVHPDTGSFICGKLIEHFVSEEPITSLQNACGAVFVQSGGDIKQVMRALLLSDEFRYNQSIVQNKFKDPFEYVVSYVRALNLELTDNNLPAAMQILSLSVINAGYETYGFEAPTGLSEKSKDWMGSASLASRIDRALTVIRGGANINLEIANSEALYESFPSKTAEGVAAYFCGKLLFDQCTSQDFESLVNAANGRDDVFNPEEEGIDQMIDRTAQLFVGTITFQMQ